MTKEFKAAPPFTLTWSAGKAASRVESTGSLLGPTPDRFEFGLLGVFCTMGLPRAPSAFAVASALTPWRSRLGPRRRRSAKGRPPFVEPEPRFSLRLRTPRSLLIAVGHAQQFVRPARLQHRKHRAQQVTRHAHNGLLLRAGVASAAASNICRQRGERDDQPPGGLNQAQRNRREPSLLMCSSRHFSALLRKPGAKPAKAVTAFCERNRRQSPNSLSTTSTVTGPICGMVPTGPAPLARPRRRFGRIAPVADRLREAVAGTSPIALAGPGR